MATATEAKQKPPSFNPAPAAAPAPAPSPAASDPKPGVQGGGVGGASASGATPTAGAHATANNNSASSGSSSYDGYLFQTNKTPTKVLDALLRAIAQHITNELGDKNDKALKPAKLAAFYKKVGGDYDICRTILWLFANHKTRPPPSHTELFLNAPHESLSYIFQVFGCRHSLEPTDNDFAAPSVPCLTQRGFVRWQSIQILLNPEEHVPFIDYAVKHWNLVNPDTGERFPTEIPAACFPAEPDPEIIVWYEACGDKLKREATPKDSPRTSGHSPAFPSAADRVNAGFSHVPAGRPSPTDYFTHRSVPFAHVSPGHASGGRYTRRPGLRPSPERADRMRPPPPHHHMTPEEDRARRRSFSDYPSPHEHSSTHLNPERPSGTARRHSHPRRFPVDEESASEEADEDLSPRVGSRPTSAQYASHRNPRFVHIAVPGTPVGTPPGVPSPGVATGGAKLRPPATGEGGRVSPLGPRRKSAGGGLEEAKDWAKGKLSGIFSSGSAASTPGGEPPLQPRGSRKSPGSSSNNVNATNLSRDSLPARLARSRSYDEGREEGASAESESEYERRKRRERRRREKDRERLRAADYDAASSRRGREFEHRREREREREQQNPRYHLHRPANVRRTSSHADVDRIERERAARYEELAREHQQRGRYDRRRAGGGLDRDARERDREREREREMRDRTASPVIKGVSGRRYPTAEPSWTGESSEL